MTIENYLKKLPEQSKQVICAACDIWSNEACRGYALAACQDLGYSEPQIGALLEAMSRAFDYLSVDDAAKLCQESNF